MKGIYIYHSGFALLDEGVTVIIDYYKDSANPPLTGVVHGELLGRPGKLYVLASHVHADHFNPEVLTWKHSRPDIQYIFSKDILEVGHVGLWDACYIEKGNVWTDGILEIEAFGSTDAGISFLLRLRGKTVFHAGDLNNWHWKEESTGEARIWLNSIRSCGERIAWIWLCFLSIPVWGRTICWGRSNL